MKWREFKNRLIWKIKKGVYLAIGSVPFVILTTLRRLGLTNLRIGLLSIDRIGHFLHADFILRQSVRDKFSVKELLFFSRKPANQQLYRMFKRRVHVISNSFFYNAFEAVHSFFRHSDVWIEPPFKRSYELINEVAPQLQFLKTEDLEGKKFLESLRIKDNAPFICFSVRDNAYLEKIHPMSSLGGWSYHDYRDCHLDNYLMAVKYLTSLGYFAIRMGYVVGQKMPEMDRVIDYAAKYRTDFSDIYLSAKCKFFLASEAGLNSVPWIFNVPVAYANVAPPLAAAA